MAHTSFHLGTVSKLLTGSTGWGTWFQTSTYNVELKLSMGNIWVGSTWDERTLPLKWISLILSLTKIHPLSSRSIMYRRNTYRKRLRLTRTQISLNAFFHFHCENRIQWNIVEGKCYCICHHRCFKRRIWQLNTINYGVKSSFINTRRKREKSCNEIVCKWNNN